MQSKPRRRTEPCITLPAHRWSRERVLQDVWHLNAHVLDQLHDVALSALQNSLPAVSANVELWRTTDSPARLRAARMPMLLLDLKFQDEHWWRECASAVTAPAMGAVQPVPRDTWLTDLSRQALMLAWPSVRDDPVVAPLLFGMTPPVAQLLASLSATQLDRLTAQRGHELKLRWGDSPRYWRQLLIAAAANDAQQLLAAHLYAVQRLAGDMICVRQSSLDTMLLRPAQRAGLASSH